MKRRFNHHFMDDFLRAPKRQNYSDPERKSTVEHDRWDKETLRAIYEEVRDFSVARDTLADFVATGAAAMGDLFYSVVKAVPELKPPEEVNPSYFVNRAVQGEIMNMNEWEHLRSYLVNDPVGAAIASTGMEPKMEQLFDMLHEESRMAQSLQDLLDMLEQMEIEQMTVDDLYDQACAACENGEKTEEAKDLADKKELIRQALEKLKNQIEEEAQDLENALEGKSLSVQIALRDMLTEARKSSEYSEVLSQMWGLEPGQLMRMPPEERIELAKRIDSAKFRKIVDVFGPAKNLAFSEQKRKYIHSREEVYELSYGNELSRVLPLEFLTTQHHMLQFDFLRRFFAGELLQYELRGEEKVIQGGIIWCEDGSGSMAGEREIWAKAIGICILHIARLQSRSFYGIHFGSPGQLARFDFRETKNIAIDDVIAFASHFFNSGTDFHTPLAAALDVMEEEFADTGRINGDIVFCTDGECGIDEEFLEKFKARQHALGFRVYGVAIDCPRTSEPLYTICDGRVITVQDILTGKDVREIFHNL